MLKLPKASPKVLLNCPFTPEDPLSIWRHFISEEDLCYIANYTNLNAIQERTKQRLERPKSAKQKRSWKKVTAAEMGGYFGALFLLGT